MVFAILILLYLDLTADFFKLLLDVLRFFLGDSFLDRFRYAFNEILCFFEAQARNLSDYLNNLNLLGGGTVNYQDLMNQGVKEKEELLNMLDKFRK